MSFSLPGEAPADRPPSGANRGAPGATGAPKTRGRKSLTKEMLLLEQELITILKVPAVPMDMQGDGWAADHVRDHSQALAKQIIRVAEEKPAFRAQLQVILKTGTWGQLVMAGTMYLFPLLIYYGLVPVPPPMKAGLAIPSREISKAEHFRKMQDMINAEREEEEYYRSQFAGQNTSSSPGSGSEEESDTLGGDGSLASEEPAPSGAPGP